MAKNLLFLLFCSCYINLFAQTKETHLKNFKERFYKDGVLDASNTLINGKKQGNRKEWYNAKWESKFGDPNRYWGTIPIGYKSFKLKKNGSYYRVAKYSNDSLIGIIYDFYKSGELFMVGQFISNMMNGKFFYFDKKGNLLEKATYFNDTIWKTDIAFYKESSVMDMTFEYKEGDEWLTFVDHYKTGEISARGYYKNKKHEGLFICWTISGNVCQKTYFKDGKEVKNIHITDCFYNPNK